MPEESMETGRKLRPNREQQRLTRRSLLKTGAATAIGVTALGSLGWRESQIIESGIQTAAGTFYPLYERHDHGIDEKDLRDDLDACFFEFVDNQIPGGLYSRSPDYLLSNWEWAVLREGLPESKDKILEKLAGNGTKVVLGDLEVSSNLIKSGKKVAEEGVVAGILGATVYLFSALPGEKVPRRNFLKTMGKLALLAGIPPSVRNIIENMIFTNQENLDSGQKDAVSRILLRLRGLVSHLEPEDHGLFFRNLIMADKLLTVAEAIKEKTGKRAKIAFNVGAFHTGMEDFLVAGHDFCRWLLSNYPPDFIENVAETNGSLENFCTARVLTLPPVANLGNADLQLTYAGKLTLKPKEVSIKDERIIDQSLFQSLTARLANALK